MVNFQCDTALIALPLAKIQIGSIARRKNDVVVMRKRLLPFIGDTIHLDAKRARFLVARRVNAQLAFSQRQTKIDDAAAIQVDAFTRCPQALDLYFPRARGKKNNFHGSAI